MPIDFNPSTSSNSSTSDIITGQGSGGGPPIITSPRMKAGSGSTHTLSSGNSMSSRIHNYNKRNSTTNSTSNYLGKRQDIKKSLVFN